MRVYLFVLVRFRQQNILLLTGEKKVKTVNTEEGKNYFICTLAEPLFGKIFKYLRQRLPTEKKKYREERRVSDSFWELIIMPGALNKKT